MPDSRRQLSSDALLDRLRSDAIAPTTGFTERTLQRLRAEPAESSEAILDTWLDAALASQPIEPRADFTARTLARLHAPAETGEASERAVAPLIQFPFSLVARLAAGIAAAVALLLPLNQLQVADAPGQATPFALAAPTSDFFFEEDAIDAQILLLAQGLHGEARWALESTDSLTLLALAR